MSEENQKREDIDPTTGLAYTTSEKYTPQKEWKTHPAWKDRNYQMDYNSEEDKPEIASVGMAMLLEKMTLDKDEEPVDLSDFDINYTDEFKTFIIKKYDLKDFEDSTAKRYLVNMVAIAKNYVPEEEIAIAGAENPAIAKKLEERNEEVLKTDVDTKKEVDKS